jgi:hypothetical protein
VGFRQSKTQAEQTLSKYTSSNTFNFCFCFQQPFRHNHREYVCEPQAEPPSAGGCGISPNVCNTRTNTHTYTATHAASPLLAAPVFQGLAPACPAASILLLSSRHSSAPQTPSDCMAGTQQLGASCCTPSPRRHYCCYNPLENHL